MLTEGNAHPGGGGVKPLPRRRPRLLRSEWLLLLVLAAIQFTTVVDFVIVVPLGPKLEEALTVNTHEFSWIVSAYGFAACITGLVTARLQDRFDRKRMLLGLYTGFALGTVLCAAAPNFILLIAGRAIAGGFAGVLGANIVAIVSDVVPESRRATALGVVMSAGSVANILGIYVGLEIAEAFGWRGPFAILACLCVPALGLAGLVLPPMRRHLAHAARRVSLRAVLLNPTHLRAYSVTSTLILSSWTIIPFLAIYLVHNVGRPETDLRYVWLCGGIFTLLTMTPTGWLADRMDKLAVFRVIGVFCLLPLLLITHLPPASLPLTLLVTTLFMVGTSIRWVPLMAMITASAAPHQRGSFLSVNSSVQQMVMALAPIFAGLLLGSEPDGATGQPLEGFPRVGVVAAAAMFASVLLAGRLRRADKVRQPAAKVPVTAETLAAQERPASAETLAEAAVS
jgi:predicted MFS family arabinose efflux permease